MIDQKFDVVFKYRSLKISLNNVSVLKTDLWMPGLKWDRPQPWRPLIYGEIRQNHDAIFLKHFTMKIDDFETRPRLSMSHLRAVATYNN